MQRKEREKAGVWGDHYGILTGGGESGQTLPVEGRRLESVSQPVCRPSGVCVIADCIFSRSVAFGYQFYEATRAMRVKL